MTVESLYNPTKFNPSSVVPRSGMMSQCIFRWNRFTLFIHHECLRYLNKKKTFAICATIQKINHVVLLTIFEVKIFISCVTKQTNSKGYNLIKIKICCKKYMFIVSL